ncbi:MAG: formamidopyrimidine-DNA glycosylase [Planctomycetes bacterium]|nr:formamidopyrimidine-DNA glycosylase [Planctomycetota bacterium]
MPELPDVVVYVECLRNRIAGAVLAAVRLASPFLLRSVEPPVSIALGKRVVDVRRLGKRIVIVLDDDLYLVIHLMISGRLRWCDRGDKIPTKIGLAAFDFSTGTLLLTEASTKKRAWLRVVRGAADLQALDPGGLEPLEATLDAFRAALVRENHTLKRALTDPRLFSGIGNAYSDEILHAAHLSPVKLTRKLDDVEIARLYASTRRTLEAWLERLRQEALGGFPEKVTAFRDGMAAHGRYGRPCPTCASPIQRIVYAENETNYCPTCQTNGRLLADRALSRLLHEDWPSTLEEMEERRNPGAKPSSSS